MEGRLKSCLVKHSSFLVHHAVEVHRLLVVHGLVHGGRQSAALMRGVHSAVRALVLILYCNTKGSILYKYYIT